MRVKASLLVLVLTLKTLIYCMHKGRTDDQENFGSSNDAQSWNVKNYRPILEKGFELFFESGDSL